MSWFGTKSTETDIPTSIRHLDFEPSGHVGEEPEEDRLRGRTCGLNLPHPNDRTNYSRCGRLAFVRVDVVFRHGHKALDRYICEPCWNSLMRPSVTIRCALVKPCGKVEPVMPAIRRWERL